MVIEEEEGRKEGSLLLCFWAKRAQKRMFDRRVDVSEVLSKFVSEFFFGRNCGLNPRLRVHYKGK